MCLCAASTGDEFAKSIDEVCGIGGINKAH